MYATHMSISTYLMWFDLSVMDVILNDTQTIWPESFGLDFLISVIIYSTHKETNHNMP